MRDSGILYDDFAAVWNLFCIRKLNYDGSEPKPWLFPILGGLMGTLLAVGAWAITLLTGQTAGAILCAVVIPLLCELFTGWRGLSAFTSFLEQRLAGVPRARALAVSAEPKGDRQSVFLMVSVYLLRMTACGFLVYGGAARWFVFAFAGAAAVRAEAVSAESGSVRPLLELPNEKRPVLWLIFGAFALCAAVFGFAFSAAASMVAAFAIAVVLAFFCRGVVLNSSGAATLRSMDVLGYGSELVMLLAGIVLSGRG